MEASRHAASASLLFAAFYVLWRAKTVDHRRWLPAVAGFLAGWAVLVELSAMLGVLVLLAYALSDARSTGRWLPRVDVRTPTLMVAGAVIPAAMLLWYNWLSFGGPFSLGYSNLANGGFAAGMGRGILGVTWPSGDTLVELLVGPRGLLRLAPWFLLAPVGLLAARRRDLRREVLVCGAVVVLFLAFNAGYYLPFGGWTPGPRFLLPALPFAAVLVALAPTIFRPIIAFLIAIAVAVFFVATVTMPNAPEMYRDPLFALWLPRLLNGDIAQTIAWLRWGLHGIQPVLVLILALSAATAALLATFRSGAAAGRLTGLMAGALVLSIVAFSFPFWPPSTFALSWPQEHSVGSIEIVEVGVTPVMTGGLAKSTIWTQVENRGPAFDKTRVVFTVLTPDGKPTWSSWYADISWREGERKRVAVQWETKDVLPGDYRVDVRVDSNDQQTIYSKADDSGVVHVRP